MRLCFNSNSHVGLTRPSHNSSAGHVFPLDEHNSLQGGLRLYVSIGGGKYIHSVVDTGSEGILFSRQFLGADYMDTGSPFCLEYTSSKNTYKGTWVWATVSFSSSRDPDSPGATVASTVRMRVRAVDERNGETDSSKISTAMIGVGFDRDTSPGQKDTCGNLVPRNINPFLQLEDMASDNLREGFILDWSRRSIVLGLPSVDDTTFTRISLIPRPYGWTAPLVTVALPDAHILLPDVILLMDCGIGNAIVQAPKNVEPPVADHLDPVKAGQRVQVYMDGLPQPLYRFTVGDEQSGAPAKLLWGHNLHDGMSFINTGRHALGQFDYLFDGERGILGFRFCNNSNGM